MRIVQYSSLGKNFFDCRFEMDAAVVKILDDVRLWGDDAVRQYTEKFDGVKLGNFEISREEIKSAYSKVDSKIIGSLQKAQERIRVFCEKQFSQIKDFSVSKGGVIISQRVIPLQRVGCYVPGGRYPLPSTALMCVVPAKVAGVTDIMVCSPKIQPVTIVAADLAGASRIFNFGGVQAIGAMAYGTKTVPKVDKIVGPGNKYVAAAKKQVYGSVGIDFVAGPSEILIIADETADARFIAAYLLAQAEHDASARPFLVTTSPALAKRVDEELGSQLTALKTRDIALQAINNGAIIVVNDIEEAVMVSNDMAPEHLGLQISDPVSILSKLRNYGSLFIGKYSAEAFGDYITGTNHILPTAGAAKYTGGLSVRDFVKVVTSQEMSAKGVKELKSAALMLAEVEGLFAHKNAVEIRTATDGCIQE